MSYPSPTSFIYVSGLWILHKAQEFEREYEDYAYNLYEDTVRQERERHLCKLLFWIRPDENGFYRSAEEAVKNLCAHHDVSTADELRASIRKIRADLLLERVMRLKKMGEEAENVFLCDRDHTLLHSGLRSALKEGYYLYV